MTDAPMRFTPQTITMSMANGRTLTAFALVSGPFALRQTLYEDDSPSDTWTVSHLPSDRAIIQDARSLEAAYTFLVAIAPLTDWTQNDASLIANDPDKLAAVKLAARIASNTTCWVTRDEAEPQYDESCTHAVCLEDIRLHGLGYDHWDSYWDCPSGVCNLDRSRAECEGEPGHDGPHQWANVGEPALSEWKKLPTPREGVTA